MERRAPGASGPAPPDDSLKVRQVCIGQDETIRAVDRPTELEEARPPSTAVAALVRVDAVSG